MAISVVMPALELTQESGKLLAWRKKEGARAAEFLNNLAEAIREPEKWLR
jgi:pyruvate/2-oxoglutarate dehydrogenase complex dihydrolipoamide acyltransferase (E2) component